MADHAGAAADVAFGDRARLRAVERGVDVLRAHVKAVDVVELAVPGLGHHRQRPPVAARVRGLPARTRHAIAASRTTPTLCVLVSSTGPSSEPDSSSHAVPVISPLPFSANQPPNTGMSRRRAAARQDRRHAGAHLASVGEVFDERDLADGDAGDVGDRVQRAGRALERNAEITRTGLGGTGERRHKTQARDEDT